MNKYSNNISRASKDVSDWYKNFVHENFEVNDAGLRNYEYIKERIFHNNTESNPYDFLNDKSILNKLKRELFGKSNSLVIETGNIVNSKGSNPNCKVYQYYSESLLNLFYR